MMISATQFLNFVSICPAVMSEKAGAHGVMVIVVGNGHSDMSSNPGRD